MSVITRRYAPPTCILEITAQTSALSRWTRQPVLKSLDFLLSFNELRDRDQQPIEVQGNQAALDALSEAVSTYTQDLLGQSLAPLPSGFSASLDSSASESLSSESSLTDEMPPAPGLEAPLTLPVQVHLRPKNLLSHELVLGALATDSSGTVIQLKASQLFDLATALDEYSTEVDTLPALVPQPVQPVVPVWARAAGIILLIGGTTMALTQLLNSGIGDPTSIISQDNSESQEQELSAPEATQTLPSPRTTPDTLPLPTPTSSLPQVQLPARDPADQISNQPLQASPQETTRERRETKQKTPTTPKQKAPTIAKLPPLPEPPPPIPPNPKDFKKPEPIEAPDIIAGRPPTELGSSNLEQNSPLPKTTQVPAAPPRVSAETSRADRLPDNNFGVTSSAAPRKASVPQGLVKNSQTQVNEARQYLAQRWQVPADLQQTLQYTLVLNANGSIQQIKPRGQAASQYLSQTPIPAVNQPFVSPSSGEGTTIRVVLGTDGNVQSFQEGP